HTAEPPPVRVAQGYVGRDYVNVSRADGFLKCVLPLNRERQSARASVACGCVGPGWSGIRGRLRVQPAIIDASIGEVRRNQIPDRGYRGRRTGCRQVIGWQTGGETGPLSRCSIQL